MIRKNLGYIICIVVVAILSFGLAISIDTIIKLEQEKKFETLREGLCVYVESNHTGYKTEYTYCLVYDESIDKIIEVDMFDELIHTNIAVGDTIVYVVDYNYTDADFVNVIHANN